MSRILFPLQTSVELFPDPTSPEAAVRARMAVRAEYRGLSSRGLLYRLRHSFAHVMAMAIKELS